VVSQHRRLIAAESARLLSQRESESPGLTILRLAGSNRAGARLRGTRTSTCGGTPGQVQGVWRGVAHRSGLIIQPASQVSGSRPGESGRIGSPRLCAGNLDPAFADANPRKASLPSLGYEQCDRRLSRRVPSRPAQLTSVHGNCSSLRVSIVSPGSTCFSPSYLQIRLRSRAMICANQASPVFLVAAAPWPEAGQGSRRDRAAAWP